MKISEHKAETSVLTAKFESTLKSEEPHELLRLFDAIDFRLLDEQLWEQQRLNDEDDVPEAPTKLLFPKFT
jgi:phosphomevalonate kinase